MAPERNRSELLFEEYLTSRGYTDWTHEEPGEGKRKNPDFRLKFGGSSLFFEVKEFDPQPPQLGLYDPYGPIRAKINQAERQFREYKEFPCSVVLANPKAAVIHLDDAWAIIGAMLGNPGFKIQLGVIPDEGHPLQPVLLGGGKMKEARNTTISSVIVLSTYPLREKRIRLATMEREQEVGRALSWDERLKVYDEIPDGPGLRRVRVIAYENPYARIPLSRDLFRGSFDERWQFEGDRLHRVIGGELKDLLERLGEDEDA